MRQTFLENVAKHNHHKPIHNWLLTHDNININQQLLENPYITDQTRYTIYKQLNKQYETQQITRTTIHNQQAKPELSEQAINNAIQQQDDLGKYLQTKQYIQPLIKQLYQEPHTDNNTPTPPLAEWAKQTATDILTWIQTQNKKRLKLDGTTMEDQKPRRKIPDIILYQDIYAGHTKLYKHLTGACETSQQKEALYNYITYPYLKQKPRPAYKIQQQNLDVIVQAGAQCNHWTSKETLERFQKIQHTLTPTPSTSGIPYQASQNLQTIAAKWLTALGDWNQNTQTIQQPEQIQNIAAETENAEYNILHQLAYAWVHAKNSYNTTTQWNIDAIMFFGTNPEIPEPIMQQWLTKATFNTIEELYQYIKLRNQKIGPYIAYLGRLELTKNIKPGKNTSPWVIQELIQWAQQGALPENAQKAAETHLPHVNIEKIIKQLNQQPISVSQQLAKHNIVLTQKLGQNLAEAKQQGNFDWQAIESLTQTWQGTLEELQIFISE